MKTAIIRHLTSGEHFLADLDDEGTAVRLSAALPTAEGRDHQTGEIDWTKFQDADLEPWDDESEQWGAERFAMVHTF